LSIHINKFNHQDNWISGHLDDGYDIYAFSAKVYDEPSRFGIGGGRVSKLSISTGNQGQIVNYDRGWDIKPYVIEDQQAYFDIVKYLDNMPRLL
jgi:hypothetical protein